MKSGSLPLATTFAGGTGNAYDSFYDRHGTLHSGLTSISDRNATTEGRFGVLISIGGT
jgi:hypothetical protein